MNPYLLNVLEAGPRVADVLLGQIPKARWDLPTHPGRFSTREVLAHLADWEPIFLARMRAAHEHAGSAVEVYDEGVRAEQQGYGQKDPSESVREFAEARKRSVAFLSSLADQDFNKHYLHPERGLVTIYDTANMLLGHDLYHLDQLGDVVRGLTAGTW